MTRLSGITQQKTLPKNSYFQRPERWTRSHLNFSTLGRSQNPAIRRSPDRCQNQGVQINQEVAVRIFLPQSPVGKLPLLVYVHGGGFCMKSAFTVRYTRLLSNYVTQCNVIGVSVEHRLFPEHPISVCYDDCWVALRWVASQCDLGSDTSRLGPIEPWIRDFADLNQIFMGGNSAGANISHSLMTNVRKQGLPGNAKVEGMILVHPYFGENDKIWMYMCPTNEGPTDPRMKPARVDLAGLQCDRVLVVVAEVDDLKDVGLKYVEELRKSGWKGKVELLENTGGTHSFHISNYMDDEAVVMNQRIKAFIRNE